MAHVEHVDRRSTIERSKLQQQVGPKMPIFGAGKMRQNAMADSALVTGMMKPQAPVIKLPNAGSSPHCN